MMAGSIQSWLRTPFTLLDPWRNRWILVLATGVFAVVFINLYVPFNMVDWYRESPVPLMWILSSFGLVGIAALLLSQFVLRWIFNVHSFSRFTFIVWFLGELLLLSVLMYGIYGEQHDSWRRQLRELSLAFRNTSLVVVIPYFSTLWYLHYRRRVHQMHTNGLAATQHLAKIRDENGVLRLAVPTQDILFFQSTDNYVSVFHIKEYRVQKELIRTSLKRLEVELAGNVFRRCHRSFMVNMTRVRAVNRGIQRLYLEFEEYPDIKIHVSRNFRKDILNMLDNK